MAGTPSNSNEETINSSSSSNKSSISQKSKMKKFQLSKSGKSDNSTNTNNKRIGLPKPKISANVVIDLESDNLSPAAPKTSQIARLYEAKLRKIERIKPRPVTSTLISKFFEEKRGENDDSDFDSRPVPITKSPVPKKKILERKRKTSRSTRKSTGENFPDIRKLVNPNYSTKNDQQEQSQDPLKPSQELNDTENNAKRIRVTLEQYGFKGAKNYEECDITALFGPSTNAKRKKIRPTLLMKKDHLEQQRILAEKVTRLLAEEYKDNVAVPISAQLKYETVSFLLENCIVTIPETFYINSNGDPIDNCMKKYYRTGLFPISTIKSGYLLKDWAAIPGRERSKSPELHENNEIACNDQISEFLQEESISMEFEEEKIEIQIEETSEKMEVIPIQITKTLSSVNQTDLDNIQARLVKASSSLNGSCEDLFADFEDDMICTDTHSTDEEGKCDF